MLGGTGRRPALKRRCPIAGVWVRTPEHRPPPHVPSACSPAVSARDDRPHGNAAVGATYCPPPARSRGLPESGPPILSRPLRAIEGAASDPAPQPPPHPAPGRTVRDTATRIAARGEGAHHTRGGEQQRRRYNIATSRTGTATWKRVRQQALKQAIDNNITHCASCGVGLDYEYTRRPNSAEV